MTTFLTLDTETNNLTTKNIVQLAAILWTVDKEIASLNVLIEPDNWTVDPKAQAIHGISLEDCQQWGVPIESALWSLESLASKADVVACHNYSFDGPVISDEFRRKGQVWSVKQSYCTMEASKPHCKIPPTPRMIASGRRGYKSPSLAEAYKWATGQTLVGSHDALNDVRGSIAVHRVILDGGLKCDMCDCVVTDGWRDPVSGEPRCRDCVPF